MSASPARTLLDIFKDTVASSPDRLAIDADDAQLTYAELSDAVRALAGRLRRFGIGPGDHVGVHVPGGTVDLYVAILGVLHAGAAYVPVDADDPPGRASTIWERGRDGGGRRARPQRSRGCARPAACAAPWTPTMTRG